MKKQFKPSKNRLRLHSSTTHVLGRAGILLALLLFSFGSVAQIEECDSSFVDVQGGQITVSPNGSDDTDNLQCAIDTAIATQTPKIQLQPNAEYFISHLEFDGFEGVFQGRSRTSTKIQVFDDTFDCTFGAPNVLGAIVFLGGSPTIRYMRISANQPCVQRETEAFGSLIRFANRSPDGQCAATTVRATVDRVDFVGPGPFLDRGHVYNAIAAFSSCYADPLLGSIAVNRSSVSGFATAVNTSMRGGARVDIRQNSFDNVGVGVVIRDAFQDTTIGYNKMTLSPASFERFGSQVIDYLIFDAAVGLSYGYFDTDFVPPPGNRLQIYGNRLELGAGESALSTRYVDAPIELDLQISDNTLIAPDFGFWDAALWIENINGGSIRGNRFVGDGDAGIRISGGWAEHAISGWAISENNFVNFARDAAVIVLENSVSESFVGRNPGTSVDDYGQSNAVLQQLFPR